VRPTRFLAFSCPHCPLQDERAVEWLLGRIEAERPDVVVHLGDGHEADSASRWPSEYDWSLSDEFEAHDALLKRIRLAHPKARRVFLEGNHDANTREIGRIDKRLRSQCDYRDPDNEPELARHWERPCDYVYDRRRGCFRIGQVTFAHGFEASQGGDEFQSILLGVPMGLFVGGHTHRPTPHVGQARRTNAVPLPYWFANPGCLRDLKPPYMTRKRSHGWGQGVVIGEAVPIKSPRMARQWDARVEIFRTADPYDYEF
jgi:predicted phosphodiesterase